MEEDSPVATPKPSKRVEEPVETPAVNPSNVKGNVKPTLEESQMGLLDYQVKLQWQLIIYCTAKQQKCSYFAYSI